MTIRFAERLLAEKLPRFASVDPQLYTDWYADIGKAAKLIADDFATAYLAMDDRNMSAYMKLALPPFPLYWVEARTSDAKGWGKWHEPNNPRDINEYVIPEYFGTLYRTVAPEETADLFGWKEEFDKVAKTSPAMAVTMMGPRPARMLPDDVFRMWGREHWVHIHTFVIGTHFAYGGLCDGAWIIGSTVHAVDQTGHYVKGYGDHDFIPLSFYDVVRGSEADMKKIAAYVTAGIKRRPVDVRVSNETTPDIMGLGPRPGGELAEMIGLADEPLPPGVLNTKRVVMEIGELIKVPKTRNQILTPYFEQMLHMSADLGLLPLSYLGATGVSEQRVARLDKVVKAFQKRHRDIPEMTFKTLVVTTARGTRPLTAKIIAGGVERRAMRQHEVRAHLRRLPAVSKSGRRYLKREVRVKEHTRGDAKEGIIVKEYFLRHDAAVDLIPFDPPPTRDDS